LTLSFSPDFIFLSSAVTSSPKRSSSSKDFLVGELSTSFAITDDSDKHDCSKSSPTFLLCLSSQVWHFVVLSEFNSFGSDKVEVVELASTVATGDDPVVRTGDDAAVATVVAAVVDTDDPTVGNRSVVTGGGTSVVTCCNISGNNSILHKTSSGELVTSAAVNERTDWIKGLMGLKDLKPA
jgi:hypothetical protein